MSESDDIDIVKKSTSCSKMSMLYINGMSISIFGCISEFDVQKRKGWIERRIRQTKDYSLENIVDTIKLSQFWLNYIQYGTRYPNVVDDEMYKEWDKDRVKPKYIDAPKSKRSDKHHNRNNHNRKHNHNQSKRNNEHHK
jgi:hypothetical protein